MTEFICRTGVRHVIRTDLPKDRPSPIQRVGIRRSVDILPGTDNPAVDADVIMTVAAVGHAFERLNAGKNCRFDYEVDVNDAEKKDLAAHEQALARINQALRHGDAPGAAELGETPVWERGGRIIGGTGDLRPTEPVRYQPPAPSGISKQLFDLAAGVPVNIGGRLMSVDELLGYQGRGAYTGFIDGRSDGQTGLMSTFRFRSAGNGPVEPKWGHRWIPADPKKGGGAPIGEGDGERIWGMIGNHALQWNLALEGMYFQDSDAARGGTGLTTDDVVGYVHGMIQAIYDVRWRRKQGEEVTPYEIAVGRKTTKLASCLPCSFFMEATGFPASSTHLGRGESWCILHATELDETPIEPVKGTGAARRRRGEPVQTTLGAVRADCNDEFAAYCRRILTSGCPLVAPDVADDHGLSFDALQAVLESFEDAHVTDYAWANLILDALTVHESDYKRINRTLRLRPSGPPDHSGLKTSTTKPSQTTEPCPLQKGSVTVEVVAVDAAEEDGPKVKVHVTPAEGAAATQEKDVTLSRGSGKAKFEKLDAGPYTVAVGPPGGEPARREHDNRFQPVEERAISLPPSGKVDITVRLKAWDAIEVMLIGTHGKPLVGLTYQIQTPNEGSLLKDDRTRVDPTTDETGKGRHERVATGLCLVRLPDALVWGAHDQEPLARRKKK